MKLQSYPKKAALLVTILALSLAGIVVTIRAAGGFAGSTNNPNANNLRQPAAVSGGLVGWYPFDGDAKDYSGNTNNASYNGATAASGKFGKAYSFVGSQNSRMDIPSTSSNNFDYNQDFAVSFWFNSSASNSGDYILSKNTSSPLSYRFRIGGGTYPNLVVIFDRSDGTHTPVVNGARNVVDGSWHHVVGQRNAGTLQLYVDQIADGSASDTTTATTTSSGTLSLSSTTAFHDLTGSLDDLRIYSRALNATEISKLYGGSTAPNCDQTCKAWLKLDDGSGTTAADSSGAGHPGTLTNFAFTSVDGWTSGTYSGAVTLSGARNDYIALPDLGLTSATLSFWIKPTSASGDQRLFAQLSGSSSQAGQVALNQSSGESGSLWVWDGTAWQRLCPAGTVEAGVWNHIVVANNGGNATAYVNGRMQLPAAAGFSFSGVAAGIGAKFLGTTGSNFTGSVDDFRVYARQLQPEEVADQWRQGT